MQTAFELLGVRPDADQQSIRSAYLKLVKSCHPDNFQDEAQQQDGQQRLIGINLAYEQAMRIAGSRKTASPALPLEQALGWAQKLLDRRQYDLVLLQLSKSEAKDARWYALQAQALAGMKQHLSCHQAWRAAVRLDPDNLDYRRQALEAEMRLKKANSAPQRALNQFKSLFQRKSN